MNSCTTDSALRFGGIALAASFGIIMLAGGHGVGPVGLLLFLGAAPEWIPGMVFGWLALTLEFLAFRWVGKKKWKIAAALAIGSFVVSAALFVVLSDTLHYFGLFFACSMLPFAVATIFRVVQVISRKEAPNQLPEPTSGLAPGRGSS